MLVHFRIEVTQRVYAQKCPFVFVIPRSISLSGTGLFTSTLMTRILPVADAKGCRWQSGANSWDTTICRLKQLNECRPDKQTIARRQTNKRARFTFRWQQLWSCLGLGRRVRAARWRWRWRLRLKWRLRRRLKPNQLGREEWNKLNHLLRVG